MLTGIDVERLTDFQIFLLVLVTIHCSHELPDGGIHKSLGGITHSSKNEIFLKCMSNMNDHRKPGKKIVTLRRICINSASVCKRGRILLEHIY